MSPFLMDPKTEKNHLRPELGEGDITAEAQEADHWPLSP